MRRLSGRSARERAGLFVAEGPQAVREAVAAHREGSRRADGHRSDAHRSDGPSSDGHAADRHPADQHRGDGPVRDLYATPDAALRHADILDAARAAGLTPRLVTDEVLAAMAETVTPQGLLAVCRLVDVPLEQALAGRPRLVAVLARVRDPGNAGTVLRAADAAGAEAVVLTDASVDVHNPKCVRSTAGSLFHLPVVTGVGLDVAVAGLRAAGLTVYAADGDGDLDLDDLLDAAAAGDPAGLAGPVAWVFGNEAWGLPAEDLALADGVVRVPVHGRAESLNLATAATVCLYAAARAQRRGSGCRVGDPS